MSTPLVIALDAMGGDNAPDMVVKGANVARRRYPRARFLLFGDAARLTPLVRRLRGLDQVCTVRHTADAVAADAKPSVALRQGRRSSMRLAIDSVHGGEAAGVVSAGNTGALMAMAKVVLKTLPGIDRPAIASIIPNLRNESVMLDLGANIDCGADNLVQFAIMGDVFARTVLGAVKPSIGLLNVGTEEGKGRAAVRDAAATLRESKLPIDFHGFIEGDDIAAGTVDVIVTDGFTGNIALKTAEGTARLFSNSLRAAFRHSTPSRLGYVLAKPALNALRLRLDPRRYNGAMFLGLNGIVVKSHGGADMLSFANAIGVAVDMAANDFNAAIIAEFGLLHEGASEAPQAVA